MSGKSEFKDLPKVLIISHNCLSYSQSNGRTLHSFFSNWDNEKIAQLYFYDNLPDSKVCKNYYRILDQYLLKSLFLIKSNGNVIGDSNLKDSVTTENRKRFVHEAIIRIKNKSKNLFIILRDLLWYLGRWEGNSLLKWLDTFKPEVIFLFPGEYAFIYNVAVRISRLFGIPIVIFNSENHYLKKVKPFSFLHRIHKLYFNKAFERAYSNAKYAIYSSELLKSDFDKLFSLPSQCILTTSELKFKEKVYLTSQLKISYAGNLGHDRWKSLVRIGKEIRNINKNYFVEVYSSFLPKEAKKYFTILNGIDFKGSVSYNKVLEVISESDIVIHTEDFSEHTKWNISHGFSTKIPDLLSSGKCFLIFGPEEIACVEYLAKNEAAWVATTNTELKNVLNKILNSRNERERYLENAKRLIDKKHNKEKNNQIFNDLMLKVCYSQKDIN